MPITFDARAASDRRNRRRDREGTPRTFGQRLDDDEREHRELRFLLTPVNYIQATNKYFSRKFAKAPVITPLGTDAVRGASWDGQKRVLPT